MGLYCHGEKKQYKKISVFRHHLWSAVMIHFRLFQFNMPSIDTGYVTSCFGILKILEFVSQIVRSNRFLKHWRGWLIAGFLMENWFFRDRRSGSELLCKKGVRKNFAKFIGKYFYQSLFYNKNTRFFISNTFIATPGWNWQKVKQKLSNILRLNF